MNDLSKRLVELSAEKRELLALALQQQGEEFNSFPLSFAQQRLWFLDQWLPANPAYNTPGAIRLTGALRLQALQQSIATIIGRHEILRTTFAAVAGQPVQIIRPTMRLPLPLLDLCELAVSARQAQSRALIDTEARRPFDLARGPLVRATLLRLGPAEHVLLLTMHHIVTDGWSLGIFVQELATCYDAFVAGRPAALPELAIQYADFAHWQRESLRGERLTTLLAYWHRRLDGAAPLLDLPTDHPRPALQTFRGARQTLVLPAPLVAAQRAVGQAHGSTLFMTLLATFALLLARASGQSDLLIGAPVANRTRAELSGLIGCFVNTLVLRIDCAGNPTFVALLARVQAICRGAYAHQELPFEQLVEAIQPQRDPRYPALIQVLCGMRDDPLPALELTDLSLESLAIDNGTAKYDLTLDLTEVPDGLRGWIEYNSDLFDAPIIARLARHFQTLLATSVADPARPIAELSFLTRAERQQLVIEWNDTAADCPRNTSLHALFAAQALRTPHAVAVVYGDAHVTYAELHRRADQLAQHLRTLGVGPEVRVGICLDRSITQIVGLLAILASGGAYVPLDPSYPAERLAFMLADSRAAVLLVATRDDRRGTADEGGARPIVVARSSFGGQVVDLHADWPQIARHTAASQLNATSPQQLAYVMYTSGSTGTPKGVMLAQRGLVNLAEAQVRGLGIQAGERVLQFASISFDASIAEIVMALRVGATIYQAPRTTLLPGPDMLRLLDEQAINVVTLPPSTLALLPAAPLRSLRLMAVAGEACSPDVVARWAPGRRFYNLYGPTEATVWSALAVCHPDSDRLPPIGRPIANRQLYLLDDHMHPVAIGSAGEVYIGGAGLARGYLDRPELTAERFVPNPFLTADDERRNTNDEAAARPGVPRPASCVRLYKTGDRARLRPDGSIEFLGRRDQQIKLRGFRIELGEVTAVLGRHPGVRECAVLVRQDGAGDQRLVAYVVPHQGLGSRDQGQGEPALDGLTPDRRLLIPDLRRFLKARLPEYMIPSAFMQLPRLPLTPNGKIDRRALPSALAAGPALDADFVAPRTPIEALLADIWAAVLGLDQVSIHDNFFELGGHSLLATRLVSRVREAFGIDLPLRCLFESPTVAELAEQVERSRGMASRVHAVPIVPLARDEPRQLSFAQRRLWFLEQLTPHNPFYNIPIPAQLNGPLDITAFYKSIIAVMRRHEVLRTSFASADGQPIQIINPRTRLALPLLDMSALPAAARSAMCERLALEDGLRPFDLTSDLLLRATLLRCACDEHLLLLTIHHIAADGWSMGVLLGEMAALYTAFQTEQAPDLPDLAIQYADFAEWQRTWLQGDVLATQLAYWRTQLAELTPLPLPTDHPRPAVETFRGAHIPVALGPDLTEALKALSRQAGVTLFMTLLAAFQVLLARYTGQCDIAVGSPIANRTRPELERLIGFFVNTLVLRSDLAGKPQFRELLGRVRAVTLAAYEHQDIPFEKLVEELQPERDMSRHPLFQLMFVLQNTPLPALRLADVVLQPLLNATNGITKFDLTFFMWEEAGGLSGRLEYNSDLFDAATIQRMQGHFATLLAAIVATPRQSIANLLILSATERRQLLVEWNATDCAPVYADCVHRLVEAEVARVPAMIAVVFEGQHLTYAELNRRANQLAHRLRHLGVGPDVLVGICVDRSLELVIALLAVLKAGGAVVALDPTYPPDRLAFMIAEARMPVLLTSSVYALRLTLGDLGASGTPIINRQSKIVHLDADWSQIADSPATNPASAVMLDHLMYAMYTSGSTGLPKCIGVPHRAFLNLLAWQATHPTLAQPADIIQFATFGFCVSFQEIFATLCVGATLVMVPEALRKDFEGLVDVVAQRAITRLYLPFAALKQLAEVCASHARGTPLLREVITAGEQLQVTASIQHLFSQGSSGVLHNQYGASETHVVSSLTLTGDSAHWPAIPAIGRPIINTQIYLLDAELQPVPVGVHGEVCVGGANLARGYLRDPALTAERFVPNPFVTADDERRTTNDEMDARPVVLRPSSCVRLYRTGDLARYLPDGMIMYLGRGDDQVKIRGFRVELGEVETVLRRHQAIADVAVLAVERAGVGKELVAYVVPAADEGRTSIADHSGTIDHARTTVVLRPSSFVPELRSYLKQTLPEYMVPVAFVLLDRLPLNANGKLDRQALPAPIAAGSMAEQGFVAARTPTEEVVAGLWAEVLGRERVGADDHFFSIGGHSLLATQVISRVRSAFQIELPLRSLFEAPTVAGLAERIEQARRTAQGPQAPAIRRAARDQPLPLSFAQQRLWFIEQLNPGMATYIFPAAARLSGPLDVAALARSLDAIMRRHEILRTRFETVDEQPAQIASLAGALALPLADLQVLPPAEQDAHVQRLLLRESQRSFDLARGPLVRAALLRLGTQQHVLVLMLHHIVADGWSTTVLIREVAALYAAYARGLPDPLPALPIQYADFAAWQRAWQHGPALTTQLAYWRGQLANLPALELPTDTPRPAIQTFRGAIQVFTLPRTLVDEINALSRREGVTLFMALLAAFQCLLHYETRSDDIVVGTDVAGRTQPETEGLIGLFVNQLVLRTNLAGNPAFRALLARVRAVALDAYAHQDVSFEQLVAELAPERSLGRNPLFQVMFMLDNTPMAELALPGLTLTPMVVDNGTVHFDLIFILRETPEGLGCTIQYNTELFRVRTIMRMSGHFERLLRAAVADPDASLQSLDDILAAADREQRVGRAGELAAANLQQLKQIRRRPVQGAP
jgi:amino acid adenylation domain-containing protein